ncbi:hypothetical protein Tco_0810735 [Tanacetum coccineum]
MHPCNGRWKYDKDNKSFDMLGIPMGDIKVKSLKEKNLFDPVTAKWRGMVQEIVSHDNKINISQLESFLYTLSEADWLFDIGFLSLFFSIFEELDLKGFRLLPIVKGLEFIKPNKVNKKKKLESITEDEDETPKKVEQKEDFHYKTFEKKDGNKNDGDDAKHANAGEMNKHDETDVYKCSNEEGKQNKDKVCNEKEDDSNVEKDDDKGKKIHYSAAYTCSYLRIIESSNAIQGDKNNAIVPYDMNLLYTQLSQNKGKSSTEYNDKHFKEKPYLDASEKIISINKKRKLNKDDYVSILETQTDSEKEGELN